MWISSSTEDVEVEDMVMEKSGMDGAQWKYSNVRKNTFGK